MKKYSVIFLCILFSFDIGFARSGRLGELFSHYQCQVCLAPLGTQDILIVQIEVALGKEPRYVCQKCREKNKIGSPNSLESDIVPASPVPQSSKTDLRNHYNCGNDSFNYINDLEKLKPKTMCIDKLDRNRTLWQRVKGLFRGASGQKFEDEDEEPRNKIFYKKYTEDGQSMLVIGEQGANRFFVVFPEDKELSTDSVRRALKQKTHRKIVNFSEGERLERIEFPEDNYGNIIFYTKKMRPFPQLQADESPCTDRLSEWPLLWFIYGQEGEECLVYTNVNSTVLNVKNIENELGREPQTKNIKLPVGMFIRSLIRLPEHEGVVVVTNDKPLLLRPGQDSLEEYEEKVLEPEYEEIPDDVRSTPVFVSSVPPIPSRRAPSLPFRNLLGEKPPTYLKGEEPIYEEPSPLDPPQRQGAIRKQRPLPPLAFNGVKFWISGV